MKKCPKCGIDKDFCDFGKDKNRKNNLTPYCKECRKRINENNSKKMSEYNKIYRKNNHDELLLKKKIYRDNNKTLISKTKKDHYLKNKYSLIKKQKEYYINNKEKINNYVKIKRKTSVMFKLTQNVRTRIRIFLSLKNITKQNKTFEIVGCSPQFLKEYLEQKFTEGMSWDLMGKHIHIDHIIPLSSANTEEDVYKLCHYTNLQPLWSKENLQKGKKLIY